MQVNEICVPYAVSVHGMHFNDSAHATSISELFIKAITHNEQRFNRDETVLFARFREAGMDKMKVARAKVSGLLTAYYTTARGYAGDILHAIFSTPRGTRTEFPALKIEACHVLLGLAPNQVLLDSTHPVCREYPQAPGGGILRVFPASGAGGVQVFTKHIDKESETAKFLLALGEFCCPILLCKTMACINLCYIDGRPHRELEVGPRRG